MKTRGLMCLTMLGALMVRHDEAATVIFLPPPATSYVVYQANVAASLAKHGHQVWLCVVQSVARKTRIRSPGVKILEYGNYLGDIEAYIYKKTRVVEKFWAGEPREDLQAFYRASIEFQHVANTLLSDQAFIDAVRALNASLIVLESMPFNLNMLVLPYMLGIPFALIGTMHDVVYSKVPFSPASTPYPLAPLTDNMYFFQRVKMFLFYLIRLNFELFHDSSLVAKFAPNKPFKTIQEIASGAEIFIAEVDHILDYPRSTLPNTKLIGGSSASPINPLIGEFKQFVDESNRGIIVVSFGGGIVNVPDSIALKMLAAFEKIDLDVVWRVNFTSSDPKHVLTSLWIPQNDLLGHEKTKLFISHCGKNGQYEALYHGVPILCLPIYGDQGYNSERVVVKQLGLQADIREVSADELAGLIRQLVFTGNYSDNMRRASRLYRELFKTPKEEAAYWLDHVIRHGGHYMRSAGQEMPWWRLCSLDVVIFILAILLGVTCILGLTLKKFHHILLKYFGKAKLE